MSTAYATDFSVPAAQGFAHLLYSPVDAPAVEPEHEYSDLPRYGSAQREQLVQDALAHAWHALSGVVLGRDYSGTAPYPRTYTIGKRKPLVCDENGITGLVALRGADRAFSGRRLPGEDFS